MNCSNCPRFDSYGICAHTLAVSKWIGVVDGYVAKYTPDVNKFVRSYLPPKTGKKPGEKTRVRINSKKTRHTAWWRELQSQIHQMMNTPNIRLPWYGIQPQQHAMVVAERLDVSQVKIHLHHLLIFFLKRYECRVFKKRGENNLSISKSKEPVYYHPLQSCLSKKYGEGNADNIVVPDHVQKQLSLGTRRHCGRNLALRNEKTFL